MAVLDEPITLFGGYVENASINAGYGADSSTCQISLVYEEDGPNRFISPAENFVALGTAVGFTAGSLEFGGVFQRYTNKRDIGGYRWDIILESPAKLLDGIQIILSDFQGTLFTGVNVYNPSADGAFTTELNNIWNVYAIRENYEYGGIFGGSDLNSGGFPGVDALTLIEEISRGEHDFGGKAVFGESEYEVDLTELIDVINNMNDPSAFRIKGPVQSLNSLIQEACDLIGYDYIVTIKPSTGSITNGVISNPVIKIKMIDRTTPPDPNAIESIITMYERQDKLITADVGKELSDAVTQRLVVGAPATRYYPTSSCIQIWGKTKDLYPRYVSNIVLDDGSYYDATEMEVRCAMGSFETWILYHLIKQYKGQLNPVISNIATTLFSVVRLDSYTIGRIVAGEIQMNELCDTTSKVWDERSKLYNGLTVRERLAIIHSAIADAGSQYYGRKYFIPLPVEAGGDANNIKWVTEDQEYISSWDICDAAYSEAVGYNDISFYDSEGRLKPTVVWDFDPDNGDYTGLNNNYCLGMGGIASTMESCEQEIHWMSSFTGSAVPYALVSLPTVNYHDDYTTMENGLYWLLNIELGIGLTQLQRLAGIGGDGVFLNFPIAPARPTPILFGIPQRSSRYTWGPWWDWRALNGRAEVIVDSTLSPETYGGYANTDAVGHALAQVYNSEVTGVESGYVELAGLPIGNIGDRFAVSGPYVTNIDVNISIDGVKTGYKFNTWTPQFGKLAKYNAERLARINKATIKSLQEQRSFLSKPAFLQPKFDLPIRKVRDMPHMGHQSSLWGVYTTGSDGKLSIHGQHPNQAMGPLSQDYTNSYGCTNEQLMTPIEIDRTLPTSASKPAFIAPTSVSNAAGTFEGNHVGPTCKDLNPYFTHTETDFQLAVHGDVKPTSLDLQENSTTLEKVRVMGMRGPMLYCGWGRGLDSTPVPAKGTSGSDRFEYADNVGTDRTLWKSGPLALSWDEERQVWAGGHDIVEGILTSDITAPASPTSPTTFTIDLYRTRDWVNTQAETVTCSNRDPSLALTNVAGMIYVMAVRINYEWRAIWIGCPEGLP